jgi:hypothetical protein
LLFVTNPAEINRLQRLAIDGNRIDIPLLFGFRRDPRSSDDLAPVPTKREQRGGREPLVGTLLATSVSGSTRDAHSLCRSSR